MRRLIGLLAALLFISPVSAQEVDAGSGVRFTLAGALQTRVSYGISERAGQDDRRLGFGVRRARFRATAFMGPRASMFFQADAAGGTFSVLDFWGRLQIGERTEVRIGRIASAQPRGLILTPLNYIDVMDRANIAERWDRATLGGGGRDFGLDVRRRFGRGQVLLFLHNGDGNWSRDRGNYRTAISGGSATESGAGTGMAVTAAGSYEPAVLEGLEVGGFAGINSRENPNTRFDGVARTYGTYGVHAYYGARPGSRAVRVKIDVLGVHYENLPGSFDPRDLFGISGFVAGRVSQGAEAFVRLESLSPDLGGELEADRYLTLGGSISLSALRGEAFHKERLTIAWSRFAPGEDLSPARGNEDLIAAQLTFVF